MRDFFKKNYFRFFAAIFFSLIFVSCSMFVSPVKPEPNQTPLTKPSSSNQKLILHANVSDDFTGSSNSASASRSAVPSELGLSTSKFAAVLYDSTSTDKDTLIEGTVDTSSGSVSLSFEFDIGFVGKTGLTLEVYSFSSTETSFTKTKAITAAKVVKLSVAEGATELNLTNPLVMLPNSANTTPGGFELIVSLPSDYNLDVSMITPITFGFLCDTQITADPVWDWTVQPDDDVPAGSYEMLLLVTKGTESCTFRKTIIIYPGVTTTIWVEASTPTAKLEITQSEITDKIAAQKYTEFYVLGDDVASKGWYATNGIKDADGNSISGDDSTGNGSLLKPYKTMQTAVTRILDLNDGVKAYTIYVDGTVTAESGSGLVVNLKDNITSPVNIKIVGLGSGTEKAVLSAGGAGADVIEIKGSETNKIVLTLENLKLTGVGTASSPSNGGGTIFSEYYSDITLNNCEVSENYCQWGGALRIGHHTNVIINGGVYKDNHATSNGGVINANGNRWVSVNGETVGMPDELTILITGGAKFLNNVSGGEGGAIYLTNLTKGCVIEDAEFSRTSARKGGVLHIDKGEATITGCTTDGTNTASERGNAICNGGTLKMSGNVNIAEDVYLQKVDTDNLRTITIAGSLTGDDVTITPESYTDGIHILIPAESVDGTTLTDTQKQQLIKDNYKKIKVAPQGSTNWDIKLDSTGLLGVLTKNIENIVSVEDVGNYLKDSSNFPLGEVTINVKVDTEAELESLVDAIHNGDASYVNLIINKDSTITAIPDESFMDCLHLKSIDIQSEHITSIGKYAFLIYNSNPVLESVTISVSVESIGEGAFSGCDTISEIIIPSTSHLKNIGESAFEDCTALTSINLPEGLETIELSAFEGCTVLENITIPSTVTTLGDEVFSGCTALKSLEIPEGIKNIPFSLCLDCVNLEEVKLPNGLEVIDVMAFSGCEKLKEISIPNTVTEICDSAFTGCSTLESVNIPVGITEIKKTTFSCCSNLQTVTIPNTVTKIGDGAFRECDKISTITLPMGITSIGDHAFRKTKLESIELPSTLQSIGEYAFSDCKLASVTIKSNVMTIGRYVFHACPLVTVTFNNTADWYKRSDLSDEIGRQIDVTASDTNNAEMFINETGSGWGAYHLFVKTVQTSLEIALNILHETPSGSTIESLPVEVENVTSVQTFFDAIKTSGVTVDEAVVKIPVASTDWANLAYYVNKADVNKVSLNLDDSEMETMPDSFRGNPKLYSLVIGSNVKKIDANAFNSCANLTSVTIDNNAALEIGNSAFYGCASLTKVKFKNATVPTFGTTVFAYCNANLKIYVPAASRDDYITKLATAGFTNTENIIGE